MNRDLKAMLTTVGYAMTHANSRVVVVSTTYQRSKFLMRELHHALPPQTAVIYSHMRLVLPNDSVIEFRDQDDFEDARGLKIDALKLDVDPSFLSAWRVVAFNGVEL